MGRRYRVFWVLARALACSLVASGLLAGWLGAQQQNPWAGKWYSSRGTLVLTQKGSSLAGSYGDKREHRILGKVDGAVLTAKFAEGPIAGDVRFERDPGGKLLRGRLTVGAYQETWLAWQKDPQAGKGRMAKLSGFWRTSLGVLELKQRGRRVTGLLGIGEGEKIRGQVKGRHLDWSIDSRALGKLRLWGDAYDDDASLYGAVTVNGAERSFVARRAVGHSLTPFPRAGELVRGFAANRLFYYLRAPRTYRRGKPIPAIVFLHGKGTNSRAYIEHLAADPKIGERYLLIGIDGELWGDKSDPGDPRNEFSFVQWTGKSAIPQAALQSPESPPLVAELIAALQKQLKLGKVLVGGHSQGGIMSYYLLMHFPELVRGVFPVAGAVTLQCQPVSFTDETLKVQQRQVPVAIVHGRKDGAMLFQSCEETFSHFADAAFPMLRLFANDGNHDFSTLMYSEAIEWLEAMSSVDPSRLIAFAEQLRAAEDFAALLAVTGRLKGLRLSRQQRAIVEDLELVVQAAAEQVAMDLLAEIRKNKDGAWVDRFLEFRAQFEFAAASAPVMAAYNKLRQVHEGPAQRLIGEAFACQQRGDQKGRWAKYQKIVDEYYASSRYSIVKIWIAHR